MTLITFFISLCAFLLSLISLRLNMLTQNNVNDMEEGLRDCATRTRSNKLELETLCTKFIMHPKPPKRRGRPRKDGK